MIVFNYARNLLNGELATWIERGIGHFLQDSKIRFTGSLFFSTPFPETGSLFFSTPFPDKAGNLAFLNNMVVISFMKLIKMEKLQKYGS